MLDRHRLEVAVSNGAMGMLADDVVVALLHQLAEGHLEQRDRQVLERAREILAAVTQLDGREVATGSVLRTMAPLRALDEAFETVNSASHGEDFKGAITAYIETLNSILAGQVKETETTQLKELFERIAQLTFARSEDLARPSRDERHEWIKKALNL